MQHHTANSVPADQSVCWAEHLSGHPGVPSTSSGNLQVEESRIAHLHLMFLINFKAECVNINVVN